MTKNIFELFIFYYPAFSAISRYRPTKATKAVEGCCTMEAAAAAERGQAPAANLGADQAAAAPKKRKKQTPKPRQPAQEGAPMLLLFRSQLPLF